MDYLINEPVNYIVSFTDYIYIPDINSILTILNENKSQTSINHNDNDRNDITINTINYVLYEYKIYILITILFTIILILVMNKFINEYLIKLDTKNYKLKDNTLKDNTLKDNTLKDNTLKDNKLKDNKLKDNNNKIKINTLKINKLSNDTDTNYSKTQNIVPMNTIVFNKETSITKGLFIDSVLEINANNKQIREKIKVNEANNYYYALLRIKLKNTITLNKTKYNIQTIIVNTDNDAETFSSSDMYMIIKFNYNHNNNTTNINLSQILVNVVNFLNQLSPDNYKNEDFVVLAISKDSIHNTINPNEFYNGLHNIKYDLCNVKQINLSQDRTIGFTLLLPIKQVYELFLDVYNDIIFESTSYKIDFDNNEYWYNNSIHEIF